MIKNLSTGKHGWRHPSACLNMLNLASDAKCKNMKTKISQNFGRSQFKAMEIFSCDRIKEHRRKEREVSEHSMRANVKKIMKEVMPEKAENFKVSEG